MNLSKNMVLFNYLLLTILFSTIACNNSNTVNQSMGQHHKKGKANQLINQSSPYLLQHAYNPVDWNPWGDAALSKAKAEDKLMIVSIGYAACHWCHVMEHESFEDSTVAKLMNDNFVNIKVDREERPDVDNIYMQAAYMTNGRGGWPLNAIVLPDGRPVYGGTYYRKPQWIKILNFFASEYKNNRLKLEEDAARMEQGIKSQSNIKLNLDKPAYPNAFLDNTVAGWLTQIDFVKGGPKRAPKFPMPNNWEFMLSYSYMKQNKRAQEAALITLDKMAMGGIYDHLGGGFARYSVDAEWVAPHFEKMMYDNGQLVSLYSHAYQLTKKQLYKDVVYETLEWVKREMTDANGGFYASLDADSEGEEGKFYVWNKADIETVLGEDAPNFIQHYGVTVGGNFEGHNILLEPISEQESAKKIDMTTAELRTFLTKNKQLLMAERDKRIRPGLDDKILTSWNALMLKGYLDAYATFGEEAFLDVALKNAKFLRKNVIAKNYELTRNYKNGKASIRAVLEDYATLSEAFITLYQVTFNEDWLKDAEGLVDYTLQHFFDEKSKMFYFTSDEEDQLIHRDIEWSDNVISSGNSIMAKVLFQLGTLTYNTKLVNIAKQMLDNVQGEISKQPRFYANWLQVAALFNQQPYEIAIVGKDAANLRLQFKDHFLPNTIFLGGKNEGDLALLKNKFQAGQTTIYVCQNKVCKLPVTEVAKAIPLIVY